MLYILDSNMHSLTLQKRTHCFHATFSILYFPQQHVAHQYKSKLTVAFSR